MCVWYFIPFYLYIILNGLNLCSTECRNPVFPPCSHFVALFLLNVLQMKTCSLHFEFRWEPAPSYFPGRQRWIIFSLME